MRFLIKKVKGLKIFQEGEIVLDLSQEKFVILIYLGVGKGDEKKNFREIINFLENCQILDEQGKFLKSIKELKPKIVFVSQITLVANFEKRGRINFNQSLDFSLAKKIFEEFVFEWQKLGYNVYRTEFGSYLEIESINLGPVNFYLEK